MNSNFSNEQIEAYASAFRAGDAIKIDGNWHKVDLEDAYPDGRKSHTAHVIGNYHVINNLNDLGGCTGVTYGFREDEEIAKFPYQITTLEDYELKGGEQLVRLGESVLGVTFGKVYRTVNAHGGVDIIDDDGYNYRPLCDNRWGVIPRYEQVAHSKERKFNQGDKVLTLSGSTGVVKGYSDNGNCLVSITNQEGENSVYNFLEEDLTVYSEEPKARRVNSFESETKDIVDELHETLVRKNADYGNSFTKSYEKWGIVSAIIRMEDKFNRLNQLYDKDSSEVNESLYDTVLDLAGYAILTARELKKADTNERG